MRGSISFSLLLALCLQQAACMTAPRPISSPRTFIPMRQPELIWLTDSAGERFVVAGPRAIGDTLYGRRATGEEVWLAFTDIQQVEARELDRRKTLAIVGIAAVAGLTYLIMASGSGPEHFVEDPDKPYVGIPLLRF